MYRWYGLGDVPPDWAGCVATIGVFDGVHRGHQRVVERAVQLGREQGLPVVVVTFDPHPDEVVRPGSHPLHLTTWRRQAELLFGLGATAVCVLPFNLEFSRLSPDEFVRVVLSERLHASAVVVGEDFRFGHKAVGDVALLAQLGEKYDFTAEGVPLLVVDGVTISSTYIRDCLAAGDVAAAAAALGRPHRVEGVVVRGHMRGRGLGFPTANVEPLPYTAIPADGVYAGWLASLDLDGAADQPLARRDLGRHQPDLRRQRPQRGGLRPRPRRPGPLRRARRYRLRRPPPRQPTASRRSTP